MSFRPTLMTNDQNSGPSSKEDHSTAAAKEVQIFGDGIATIFGN